VQAGAFTGLLWACATAPPGRPSDVYLEMGAGGTAIVRAITAADACPTALVDGAPLPMHLRMAPQEVPARAGQVRPSNFPVRVCEATVPAGAQALAVDGQPLKLPASRVARIVVLGDTGCRIKASDRAYQACDDPQQWPFAQVSAAAAREAPDLVLHVGDYHYRESPCPSGKPCAGSVWGYGWEAWNADFFTPARPLLQAAPWIFVRGNHEECARAGQGWFRFLDPAPFEAARSCDDAREDGGANFSEPYAVPLGGQWQVIVFDSARAGRPPAIERSDLARIGHLEDAMRKVAALAAAPGMHSLFVSHHPALGFATGPGNVRLGTDDLLMIMRRVFGPAIFPPGVEAGLHGHVHAFQAVDFSSGQPPAIVAGNGGDLLDEDLTMAILASHPGLRGVSVAAAAHAGGFGYLVMEREEAGWRIQVKRSDGSRIGGCRLGGGHVACDDGLQTLRPPAN
jgi:hypothetical protein